MGLDIRAFSVATLTDEHAREGEFWCGIEDHKVVFCYDGFEQSLRGLVVGRCYDVGQGVSIYHHAGSYGGYNAWRDRLARVHLGVSARTVWRDPEAYRDRPFYELINFADNEGFIGPEAAADLLLDFEAGRDRWMVATDDDVVDHDDRRKYDEWTKAFRTAAGHGLVRFA